MATVLLYLPSSFQNPFLPNSFCQSFFFPPYAWPFSPVPFLLKCCFHPFPFLSIFIPYHPSYSYLQRFSILFSFKFLLFTFISAPVQPNPFILNPISKSQTRCFKFLDHSLSTTKNKVLRGDKTSLGNRFVE